MSKSFNVTISKTLAGAGAFTIPLSNLVDLEYYLQLLEVDVSSSANVVLEMQFNALEQIISCSGTGELITNRWMKRILANSSIDDDLQEQPLAWDLQAYVSGAATLDFTFKVKRVRGDKGQLLRALNDFIQDWDGLIVLPEWNNVPDDV